MDTCNNCLVEIEKCDCGETEGYSSDVILCPYCGYGNRPEDSDGEAYNEDLTDWTCNNCGKDFDVDIYFSNPSWTTTKKSNNPHSEGGSDE